MKKYFVSFTYKKEITTGGGTEMSPLLLTFEIVELQPTSSTCGEILPNLGPSNNKEGVLLALGKLGYLYEVNILLMNPL